MTRRSTSILKPTRRHVLMGLGAAVTAAMLPAPPSVASQGGTTLTPQTGRLSIPAASRFGDLSLATWAYDGIVPGPLLRYRRGDTARVRLVNDLPEPTSIHWHGLRVPNAMDGAAPLTQPAVEPGETFDYAFPVRDAGTYWYHTHTRGWYQQDRGLYGPLIVDETNPPDIDREILLVVDDWLVERGGTVDESRYGAIHDWAHAGRLGSVVTVNSRSVPAIEVRRGERLRVRLLNVANAQIFAIAFEGHDPWLIAGDGDPVQPQRVGDAPVTLGPGQRADLIVDATADPASEHVIRADTLTGEGPIARLVYSESDQPVLGVSGSDVPALEPNDRPEPDIETARQISLLMEGGAMGMMDRGMHMGRMMSFRQLAASGRVWTFNGIAGDMDEPLARLALGESAVLDITNRTRWPHSMHLHGMHFRTLSRNGEAVEEGFRDTVTMGPMEQATVAFVAEAPGRWMLHCHMIEHQAGGMMTWIDVQT